jgi:hypothetical protein
MSTAKSVATSGQRSVKARIITRYKYRDEAGNVLFEVVRFDPKDFRQRRRDKDGDWIWNVSRVRTIPYRLPELLAHQTQPVFVVEGEKDADNLAEIGFLATCNAGGAGKWTAAHAAFLRGRTVYIIPDNHDIGRNHAQQVAQSLDQIAKTVKVLELPGLPDKGDVSDWLDNGGTADELKSLATAAPIWSPGAQTWPEIISFDVLDLPEFPTDALPEDLRQWVVAESHATQTPPDLAALLSLAVCSASLARRVVVEPRPGWQEPVNLFTAVLLEPGNRKSAVFADATKPIRDREEEMIEAARSVVACSESERRQNEMRLQNLEKISAENPDAKTRRESRQLAAALAEPANSALPRLIVDDATAEKLGIMLADQDGRIASMSAEGGVFDLMAGLYSKSGIPQFGVYLMGHSGDELMSDRVGRKSVRVKRPALTCAYAIQPSVIRGLSHNAAFRGRGLLARFLYAAPRSWIGRREIAPLAVSEKIKEIYWRTVRRLADVEGEHTLYLTEAGTAHLEQWENEVEVMLGDGGEMEVIRDWGAKLAGATVRLAGILHCIKHGPVGHIKSSTIAAAVKIARYLIPHAEAVLVMMSAGEKASTDDARYVLRWIERHGKQEFTKTEAQHHGKRRFRRADDIDPALAELVRRGYIRPKPPETTGPGRPPSPAYEVNPASFDLTKRNAAASAETRSQNSCNRAPNPESEDIGNIGSASLTPTATERVRRKPRPARRRRRGRTAT